jgi:hypothetical protein
LIFTYVHIYREYHGTGKLVYENGDVFEGNFSEGLRDGVGLFMEGGLGGVTYQGKWVCIFIFVCMCVHKCLYMEVYVYIHMYMGLGDGVGLFMEGGLGGVTYQGKWVCIFIFVYLCINVYIWK